MVAEQQPIEPPVARMVGPDAEKVMALLIGRWQAARSQEASKLEARDCPLNRWVSSQECRPPDLRRPLSWKRETVPLIDGSALKNAIRSPSRSLMVWSGGSSLTMRSLGSFGAWRHGGTVPLNASCVPGRPSGNASSVASSGAGRRAIAPLVMLPVDKTMYAGWTA
eukprot:CAMPEP_0174762866 /NCGR_PEP_ID=MMETSP1094-20130205/109994_1 /TAXON_ID=156173 /ORGANISM="Chrysochromulina brevifilum, Strain UTEX LB 985" /LENGTH=165 /DNA_ID=CAMNT_0015968823 /DNA_START=384 /DNA_END=881 /DNA_ORIENTATION=+